MAKKREQAATFAATLMHTFPSHQFLAVRSLMNARKAAAAQYEMISMVEMFVCVL